MVTGLHHDEATRQILEHWNQPIVEIMELGEGLDLNVGMDHVAAGRAMTEHLLARGYRTIQFAGAELDRDYRAAMRYAGHREALAAAGIEEAPLLDLPVRQQMTSGAQALERIRESHPDCDAIHFANDDMACGAILAAARLGVRIPEDIAIAGFNGLPIGEHVTPRLTTIVSPREQIGRVATRKLLARINGDPVGELSHDLGFTLRVGDST